MPSNRASKRHIREQQRPGESYTAAMRRLRADPVWELDADGMGTTEYRATVDGTDVVVSFVGDHRRPWDGYWYAMPADDLADCLAGGRHRFSTPHPDDEAIAQALDAVTGFVRQVAAGQHPDTVDTSHGPAAARALDDGGCYFFDLGGDVWLVAEVLDLRDSKADFGPWRIDPGPDTSSPAQTVTWDVKAACWRTDTGATVGVFEL